MNRKFTFCVIVSILFSTAGAFGAIRNVPGTYPNIQAAITAASAGDEVVVADSATPYTGIGNHDIDFGGKAITVRSASGNPANCIIDCQFLGRAFYFYSGETDASVVRGFTIRNGSEYYGGAIECEMSSPTIENCILTNNDATAGGAIDCYYSSPLVKDCVITNNTADDGGAIETGTYSSPTIQNCLITSNTASYNGGAIDSYDSSSPAIINCTITDNNGVSNNKGGVYALDVSHPTIINSILWNNGDDIVGATATYSCIEDNDSGTGNIHTNPEFRTGPSGNYYLSQIAAGQLADSGCVNTGNNIGSIDVTGLTTKTNNGTDSGNIDMGYHYKAGGTVPRFTLITGVDPNTNWGTLAPNYPSPGQLYNQFSEVQLTAAPNTNYAVKKWNIDGIDTSSTTSTFKITDANNAVITMNANHSATVSFISTTLYRLATTVIGGNGIMDNYPDPNSPNPTAEFPKHTQVTVNAYPTPGNVVKRWIKGNTITFDRTDPSTYTVVFDFSDSNTYSATVPGSDHTAIRFPMDANTTVGVEFIANPTTVLLDTRVINGHGTLTPRRGNQPFGKIVTLKAVPDAGYRVKAWSGTDNDLLKDPNNTVTMNTVKTVSVEFEKRYFLTTTINDPNIGGITPFYPDVNDANAGWFLPGTIVTLTALPNDGNHVMQWIDANTATYNPADPCTFTVTVGNTLTHNITMDVDKTVLLAFEPPPVIDMNVIVSDSNGIFKSKHLTIQAAIDAAGPGDDVNVPIGIWTGTGNCNLDTKGKSNVTVHNSTGDPNDTIIDCNGSVQGITFKSPTDPNALPQFYFKGFTIKNGNGAKGGGVFAEPNSSPQIDNCIIRDCTATQGGGIYLSAGKWADKDPNRPVISRCIITNNTTTGVNGHGGGIYFEAVRAIIRSTEISHNTASHPTSYGGGLYAASGAVPEIINCLFHHNVAVNYGGAIYLNSSNAMVKLCTVMYNRGLDDMGGIYARSSTPVIEHCIIGGSRGDDTAAWGINEGVDLSGCSATYSCIESGGTGTGNITGDPIFVTGNLGDFYLSQIRGGQAANGSCIDKGQAYYLDDLQAAITEDKGYGLEPDITTGVVQYIYDIRETDIGYHYPLFYGAPIQHSVTLVVIGNGAMVANDGTNTYPAPGTYQFTPGTTLNLTAMPGDANHRVKSWTGTDDDSVFTTTNTVTLYAATNTVTVEFEERYAKTIHIPGDYPYVEIQRAIDEAKDGDEIIIESDEYIGTGFTVIGKNLIISGGYPNDANRTVISCRGEIDGGIYLYGDGAGSCVLMGLTIKDIDVRALNGLDGKDAGDPGNNAQDNIGWTQALFIAGDHKVINCNIRNARLIGGSGGDGKAGDGTVHNGGKGGEGGDAAGAGIFVAWGSPVVQNCIIEDCNVIGGNGGNGGNGNSDTTTPANSGVGGRGGYAGRAYGAGICLYDGLGATPTFENCTIRNCQAIAGNGGNGGDSGWGAGPGAYGGLTDYDSTQEPPSDHSANGGAVYIGSHNWATFINCTIANSSTKGSVSGIGGRDNPGNVMQQPRKNTDVPSFGGGIYIADNAIADFNKCNIQDCNTDPNKNYYTSYGGGIAAVDAFYVELADCNITGNFATVGGGFHGDELADLHISDSNISSNYSYIGGGMFLSSSDFVGINNCVIKGNSATFNNNPDPNVVLGEYYGAGGGIYSFTSDTTIFDCEITENIASGFGGGVYLGGDPESLSPLLATPEIKNCLITDNTAEAGGGVAATFGAEATITNSTIANNNTSGVYSSGGGLFAAYGADVFVTDTIFWKNSAINGSQIGLSSGGIFVDMPATLDISYSDIGLTYSPGADLTISGTSSGTTTLAPKLVDSQAIYSEINASGTAKVIVTLTETAGASASIDWSSATEISALQTEVASLQNQVLTTLNTGEFTLRQKLTNTAIFSGQINAAGLNKLVVNSRVAHIEPVRKVYPALAQAIPLANAMATRPSYNGSGISIAIVDTGVDYTHPRLGGGSFPNSKVIGGYDTGARDSDPMPVGKAHGTCCAGIAAGLLGTVGDYIGGVAYNAKIYALKASPDDAGYFEDDATLAAWDWCVSHRNDNPANPIKVMSNSWGSTSWFTNSHAEADAFSPAHTASAKRAVNAGITILVCSQNQGQTNGICWPSAMSDVISVGAVYDTTDQVTEYSNTADILDILAPADPVYTTDIVGAGGYSNGDYYPYFNGTSSACPFAAGAVAAMQSAAKQTTGQYLTPGQVKDILVATGRQITDTKVAITKPRVDLGAAIASISPTAPVYIEDGDTIYGLELDANDVWAISAGSGNIDEDPEFVFGYYLGRTKTGQDTNSPCIDAGSMSALAAQLESYTTRLDGIFDDADDDANVVDMGYHYKKGIGDSGIYDITIKIIEDANYPGIHGTISANPNMFASHPDSYTYTYRYYAGMTPTFTAKPDPNDLTIRWYDANDATLSTSDKYTLAIDSNEKIFVKFSEVVVVEQQPRVLHVPTDYQSLQYAINDAQDGDRIILAAGTYLYNDNNFDYGVIYVDGKSITIASSNPDDPCVVAATIIRGNGFVISNVDSTMALDGITIQDAHYHGGNPLCTVNGPTGDGLNGGSIFGGAIELRSASPTIRNCRFVNCSATGGDGCPGTGEAGDGGWAGYAYGGAIGIDKGSSPYIKNCEFINCYARGGNGGDGATHGHGGNWGDPSYDVWHTWDYADGLGANGGYMDYWYYGGRGGAVYVEAGGKARIENCLFQGNRAESGHCGKSNVDAWPNYWYAIDAYGGAVYMAAGSEVSFDNCYFINNEADTRNQLIDANGYDGEIVIYSPVISFGGGIYAEGSAVPKISNCRFTNNRACAGGGMYWEDSTAYIDQSIFEDGDSMFGGGLAIVDSNSIIFNCKFNNNRATEPGGQGGGIYSASSAVKFFDCTFEENIARASGGGAYFAGNLEPNMHNCLIVNNEADRDGGGVSANWNTWLELSNCTITNNKIVGGGFASGFGGGVSVAYEAYVKIINSIIWNNNSEYGETISIGNVFEAADKYSAEVSVSYSNLQNGQTGVFVDTASGCQLDWGNGNLLGTTPTAPSFMAGYWGDFYLRQPTGQTTPTSPCVDSGEGQAIDYDLFRHTTRTDHTTLFGQSIDSGRTDMGYHYLLYDDLRGDFNYNGQVSRPDLALFVEYWLEDGCTFPYFCHGRDLNEDGEVNYEDYAIFASNYGKIESTPPFPNPMMWKMVPDSYGDTVIAMEATTARDNSGAPVMYNFVRYGSVIGDDHDYGWQSSPKLINTGLVYKRKYGYKVRAKDARGNLTGFSVIKYAYPGEHLLPPTPDPMTWAVVPVVISTSQITMTATIATDETPTETGYGVEYYFDETSGNPGGSDSGWQASPIYTDTYLDANTTYTYRVMARDTSPNYNETGWSTTESATTPPTGGDGNEPPPVVVDHTPPTAADGTPLTPSSMWAITPRTWDDGYEHYNHYMAAVAAVDANSPPVRYYFECTAGNGISSGWIVGTPNTSGVVAGTDGRTTWSVDSAGVVSYTAGEFGSANQSSYRIRIKDSSGNSGTEVVSTTLNTW